MDTLPDFLAFAESEGLATPENDGIKVLGAFLRSLSAFYKVRDCERLVAETIDRLGTPGASPQLSKKHCVFNLDDVKEVLSGAKVNGLYDDVIDGVKPFKKTLKVATAMGDTDTLEDLLCDLETMRDDIATTTEVIPSFCGP